MSGDTDRAVEAGLRRMGSALDFLDGALDDTHPEGDGCDICRAADELREAFSGDDGLRAALASSRPAAPDSPDPDWLKRHADGPGHHYSLDDCRAALSVEACLAELAESPLPGARYAYEVVRRRLSPSPESTSGSRDSEAGR